MTSTDFVNTMTADSPTGTGSSPVTKSDTVDIASPDGASRVARRLYIEGAGNIKITGLDGQVDTWAVPANFYLNVAVKRVWSTGTTVTGTIHAIW